jgi:transcriptional regulator with XRE-family HTH domain
MKAIYQTIKYLAEKKKVQQKEIAEALNVGTNTVNNWVQGKTSMKAEQIPLIAKCLRVSVSELFNENTVSLEEKAKMEEAFHIVGEDYMCPNCYKFKSEVEVWKDKYIYLLENGVPKKETKDESSKESG